MLAVVGARAWANRLDSHGDGIASFRGPVVLYRGCNGLCDLIQGTEYNRNSTTTL